MSKRVLLCATVVVGAMSIGGCATVIEGTSQEIFVNTNPQGAECSLNRVKDSKSKEVVIGRVSPTPGKVKIDKTKYDITIICDKQGYQQATYLDHSGAAGATVGNIILGGGIGWAIDSAAGSDNKYDTPVNITLVPVMPVPAALPPSPAVATPPVAPTEATPANPGK